MHIFQWPLTYNISFTRTILLYTMYIAMASAYTLNSEWITVSKE